ncbi:MAG: ubiquinol-cytochrome C chaperone family protein [Pseudomonadota bacterium]|nr:ubiquinol-cytochrome C chaperone family protein [Pseudomonadota bacterium]
MRAKHWYLAGEVPDTMDGRFALLATVVALVTLRLEAAGGDGVAASVGLTEAFIDDMDAQMRQQGFDATLSKQVRSLVGSLASRVDRWRRLIASSGDWQAAVRTSVYRDVPVNDDAVDYMTGKLRSLWDRLGATSLDDMLAGRFA